MTSHDTSQALLGPNLLEVFDRLYIINLPERTDRWNEMQHQLRSVGLDPADPRIVRFDACRADAPDGFPTAGTHGCYLSHLAVLREARKLGLERVLIAEDDLDFAPEALDEHKQSLASLLQPLTERPWHVFFAGYHFPDRFRQEGTGLVDVSGRYSIGGCHLYAISASIYDQLITYFEDLLAGPGPKLHFDDALSRYRNQLEGCVTYVLSPAFGIQRRSRSDIQQLRFYDRLPGLRQLTAALRRVMGRRSV